MVYKWADHFLNNSQLTLDNGQLTEEKAKLTEDQLKIDGQIT
jgi:hypothetical protein